MLALPFPFAEVAAMPLLRLRRRSVARTFTRTPHRASACRK